MQAVCSHDQVETARGRVLETDLDASRILLNECNAVCENDSDLSVNEGIYGGWQVAPGTQSGVVLRAALQRGFDALIDAALICGLESFLPRTQRLVPTKKGEHKRCPERLPKMVSAAGFSASALLFLQQS